MSTFNLAVQVSAPHWVQARALGTYQMVFSGGMALGSVIWGLIAEHSRRPSRWPRRQGAAGHSAFHPATARAARRTARLEPIALNTSSAAARHGAGDVRRAGAHPDRLLRRPEDYNDFVHAIHELKNVRLRDGAMRWGIFQDANDPRRLNETFIMESWIDYLRQRERFTASDLTIRDRVFSFHRGDEPPRITHTIYAKEQADCRYQR